VHPDRPPRPTRERAGPFFVPYRLPSPSRAASVSVAHSEAETPIWIPLPDAATTLDVSAGLSSEIRLAFTSPYAWGPAES
jgi:hypothetical protein